MSDMIVAAAVDDEAETATGCSSKGTGADTPAG